MAMPTLLDVRSFDQEPLPLYSRQDPDSASIRSAAPSYVSDTPTYNSYRAPVSLLPPPSPGQHTIGLPAPRRYAPGFAPELRNRTSGRTSEFTFNTNRHTAAAHRSTSTSTSSSVMPPSPALTEMSRAAYSVQAVPAGSVEGPRVLGEDVAEGGRGLTAHREVGESEQARREESRGWNFMLSQMGDWEGRRRSWSMFRENLPKKAKRRFGRRG